MYEHGLYYNEIEKTFSENKTEGFKLICFLDEIINKEFENYCTETLPEDKYNWPSYEGIVKVLNEFIYNFKL